MSTDTVLSVRKRRFIYASPPRDSIASPYFISPSPPPKRSRNVVTTFKIGVIDVDKQVDVDLTKIMPSTLQTPMKPKKNCIRMLQQRNAELEEKCADLERQLGVERQRCDRAHAASQEGWKRAVLAEHRLLELSQHHSKQEFNLRQSFQSDALKRFVQSQKSRQPRQQFNNKKEGAFETFNGLVTCNFCMRVSRDN